MARTRNSPHTATRHATTQEAESDIPPASTQQAITKTVRQNKRSHEPDIMSDSSEQPAPVKKAKTMVSKTKRQREVDDAAAVPTKKARATALNTKKAAVTQQQSPARRSARNPAKSPVVTQKRKRRTKAEITADLAKAEMEKKRMEELTKDNNRAMVQMDINEDINRADTANRTIRKFTDLNHSSGEEFIGYSEVSGGDSESDLDGHAEDAVTQKEVRKAPWKRLKGLKVPVNGGKKNGVGGKKSAKQVTFASGLLPDWNSKAEKRASVQISAGGLDDSDAEAVNPFPQVPSKYHNFHNIATKGEGSQITKRDLSRRNELVSVASTDEEADYVPHPAAKKVATKVLHTAQVKAEKRDKIKTPVTAVKTKVKRLNGNNVRMSDLPEFAQGQWRETFLPTLYDKFFASDQPFDGFHKGSNRFIALLQTIVEEVFPHIDYELRLITFNVLFFDYCAKMVIVSLCQAYNRINEKRSSIGSQAINLVKTHIGTLGGEKAAKEWLRWSLRMDGPLFFKVPSPFNSPIDNRDGNYQFPQGRLLSKFVISLAAPLITLKSNSASENGYPKGLVALIMAALERAVTSFLKPSVKVKEFSKEFWGSKVETYNSGFQGRNGVPDSRWKELLDACRVYSGKHEDSDEDNHQADLSMLDNNRAFVFNFCSPEKSRA